MIFLHKPYIKQLKNKSRLYFDIDIDNEHKSVWFEVDNAYSKYLTVERIDAILIGMLSFAMRGNHNIFSDSYVTDEVLYKIKNYLLPTLSKYDERLHNINIDIKTAPALKNAGAVGTGASCGIDSIHAYLKNFNNKSKQFKLTHLCINNVGAFNETYKDAGIDKVKKYRINQSIKFAKDVNLPLIVTDSNFLDEVYQNHSYTHTYSSCFAILCLQKMWGVYYYGSSGFDYSSFNVVETFDHDPSCYELLSLNCFSTNNLKIYSEGAAETRLEKTSDICSNDLTKKYLHVCTKDKKNCNICPKCMRTLLTLYALDANLSEYSNVFDIKYFNENIDKYFEWIYKEHLWSDKSINEPTYLLLLKKESFQNFISNYNSSKYDTSASWSSINYKEEYEKIVNSKSFKVGYMLLWVPRKVKNIISKVKKKKSRS